MQQIVTAYYASFMAVDVHKVRITSVTGGRTLQPRGLTRPSVNKIKPMIMSDLHVHITIYLYTIHASPYLARAIFLSVSNMFFSHALIIHRVLGLTIECSFLGNNPSNYSHRCLCNDGLYDCV
jgi:hypothetical protein